MKLLTSTHGQSSKTSNWRDAGYSGRRLLHWFRSLTYIAAIACCGNAAAEIINIEEAIEAYGIEILKDPSGNGLAFVKNCQNCEPHKLSITPQTAIYVGGHAAKPGEKIKSHWQGGVVIYNVAEMRAVRLDL